MNHYRIEHDSMGDVKVPSEKYWGAQTQRSHENFEIGVGIETMPHEIIRAFGILKKACAFANYYIQPEKMPLYRQVVISEACDEVIDGKLTEHFPLVVWQTGSGTQTNMNANEVIANRANEIAKAKAGGSDLHDTAKDRDMFGKTVCHPNDDVNMSQSSNDTFPTAMNIAAVLAVKNKLFPAMDELTETLGMLEDQNEGIIKCGRTHLQDAVPIAFSQEISGWKAMVAKTKKQIEIALESLCELAIGGTAVGTGLNAPKEFDKMVAIEISNMTKTDFYPAENKFHALASKDAFVFVHGAIKSLACNLMKIANDIRWLASGPRNGLGEIFIPENEPGSSIMPGKVNPTQCEAITMIAVQVMSNDVAVSIGASQGNFELNVFMPVIAYNFLQSVRLLAEGIRSFNQKCVCGIRANREKMAYNLEHSLMLVTALNPYIGYENAAKVAKKAHADNISLKEACVSLGFLTSERFDEIFHPENMAYPHKDNR